ncbi:MAG: biotin synthase BioB [Actinomycetota bacterium]
MPLARADHALLTERRRLTRREVLDVALLPSEALPELIDLAHRVRLAYKGPQVELESLVNAKSGNCTEECGFCSQSVFSKTQVERYPMLDPDKVLEVARETKKVGATQFCIVVAVKGPDDGMLERVMEIIEAVRIDTGLDVAASLGILKPGQAERLKAAGLKRYNHNLETCRAMFPTICTTHSWQDRFDTNLMARAAGLEICCGGIIGLGETIEQRVDFMFEIAELEPEEVPVNLLDPQPGTAFEGYPLMAAREALHAIALFRLVFPSTWLRLAGGRERVLGELQGMGMLAGANALIVGNYLTTIGRAPEDDLAMLDALGMPIADGPGEGRLIVDGEGSQTLPPTPVPTLAP